MNTLPHVLAWRWVRPTASLNNSALNYSTQQARESCLEKVPPGSMSYMSSFSPCAVPISSLLRYPLTDTPATFLSRKEADGSEAPTARLVFKISVGLSSASTRSCIPLKIDVMAAIGNSCLFERGGLERGQSPRHSCHFEGVQQLRNLSRWGKKSRCPRNDRGKWVQ